MRVREESRTVAAVALATDRGWVRDGNEDAAAAVRLPGPVASPWVWVAAVADGIGGIEGGEVASRGAVDAFVLSVQELLADGIADPAQLIERGFVAANAEIAARAQSPPGNSEMGTTLTTALLSGRRLWVGHVGDSRLYLVRRGQARRITRDHEVRGRLTRYLGAGSPQAPDVLYLDLKDGDVVVLCTDGMYRRLPEREIADIVRRSDSVAETCDDLVAAAKERDGSDNITAVCIAVGKKAFRTPMRPRRLSLVVLLLAVLVAITVVAREMMTSGRQKSRTVLNTQVVDPKLTRLGIVVSRGRLKVFQGATVMWIGSFVDPDGRHNPLAAPAVLPDQRVTINLPPEGKADAPMTFNREGKSPRVRGYKIDGGGLIQSNRVVIERPKESISFHLAGADGGEDVPVQILFGRDVPDNATEAAPVGVHATTKPSVSRPDDRAGHRDQGARTGGARPPSARTRG